MIMNNISHEMLVDNPKYDNLPDYDYNEISYNETYEDVNGDKKLEKRLVDLQRKRWIDGNNTFNFKETIK